jgi:TRAP-type mannitol/chloroaromatic compound transport system permease small subunit
VDYLKTENKVFLIVSGVLALSSIFIGTSILYFVLGMFSVTVANVMLERFREKKKKVMLKGKLTPFDQMKVAEYVERKEYMEAVVYMIMKAYNMPREKVLSLSPEEVKELVSKIEYA